MEGWKFIDYTQISPLAALSITTDRWGLEQFPSNLRVTRAHIPDLVAQNISHFSAWEFLYGCNLTSERWTYKKAPGTTATQVSVFDVTRPICAKPRNCAQAAEGPACISLIEGIGRTKVGSHDIVPLVHGITVVIVIVSTLIMGWFKAKLEKLEAKFPARLDGITDQDLNRHYNPPIQQPNGNIAEPIVAPPNEEKAKEIAHCADLLRQMYSLDMEAWAMENNHMTVEATERQRQKKDKANALHREIWRIVFTWKVAAPGYFTAEEVIYVTEICTAMENYQRRV